MSIAWMAPAALLGLALIALPIAIHLLVRQHARTLAFPSLRFLRETQLAAFRRRRIEDAALLACRAAIIALAAVALAGPVLQTAARTAGYAGRTSRAVVALDGAGDNLPRRSATAHSPPPRSGGRRWPTRCRMRFAGSRSNRRRRARSLSPAPCDAGPSLKAISP